MPPTNPASRKTRSQSTIQHEQNAAKQKRQHFVNAIKRVLVKLDDAEVFAQQTQFDLDELFTTLNDNWSSYRDEYSKIFDETLEVEESAAVEEEFITTEKMQISARSKIRGRLAEITPKPAATQQQMPTPQPVTIITQESSANIPNSWGHFAGDYAEWPSFRDRYKARIHARKDILTTHKWGYLRSSLSGDAQSAMGKWKDTDENYEHAWNRLCHQYDDSYMAVQTLIQKLLNIQKMQRASSEALRNISDIVHGCLSQLGSYVSTASWDPLIIFLIVDKLDNDTRKDWEKQRHSLMSSSSAHSSTQNLNASNNEPDAQVDDDEGAVGGQVTLPTWTQMEAFLDQQAKILRDIAASQASSSSQQQQNASGSSNANAKSKQKSQNTQGNQRINENLPCLLCRVKHPVFSCPTWKAMTVENRETYQRTNKLCITCAQPSHGNTPCWGKPGWAKRCPTCWDAAREEIFHNSTLCRRTEAKRMQQTLTMTHSTPKAGAKPKKQ